MEKSRKKYSYRRRHTPKNSGTTLYFGKKFTSWFFQKIWLRTFPPEPDASLVRRTKSKYGVCIAPQKLYTHAQERTKRAMWCVVCVCKRCSGDDGSGGAAVVFLSRSYFFISLSVSPRMRYTDTSSADLRASARLV